MATWMCRKWRDMGFCRQRCVVQFGTDIVAEGHVPALSSMSHLFKNMWFSFFLFFFSRISFLNSSLKVIEAMSLNIFKVVVSRYLISKGVLHVDKNTKLRLQSNQPESYADQAWRAKWPFPIIVIQLGKWPFDPTCSCQPRCPHLH